MKDLFHSSLHALVISVDIIQTNMELTVHDDGIHLLKAKYWYGIYNGVMADTLLYALVRSSLSYCYGMKKPKPIR